MRTEAAPRPGAPQAGAAKADAAPRPGAARAGAAGAGGAAGADAAPRTGAARAGAADADAQVFPGARDGAARVPRAAREAREATIDVEAWDPHSADTPCVDDTVRHEAAVRYRPQASDYDGHALRIAEAEKQARYPPRGDLRCTCAAAETYGRPGDVFEVLIDDLAGRAAQRDILRGLPPTPWARRWRVQLSVGMHRALARSLEEAIRGPAGAERPRGADCAR